MRSIITRRAGESAQEPVLIIGAGLAGLACARVLDAAGLDFLLLEAAESVGGRVRTDKHDGFLLDRGFQVLLTAYPEAADVLDYTSLQLRKFQPGALIRSEGCFHRKRWSAQVSAKVTRRNLRYHRPGRNSQMRIERRIPKSPDRSRRSLLMGIEVPLPRREAAQRFGRPREVVLRWPR